MKQVAYLSTALPINVHRFSICFADNVVFVLFDVFELESLLDGVISSPLNENKANIYNSHAGRKWPVNSSILGSKELLIIKTSIF